METRHLRRLLPNKLERELCCCCWRAPTAASAERTVQRRPQLLVDQFFDWFLIKSSSLSSDPDLALPFFLKHVSYTVISVVHGSHS